MPRVEEMFSWIPNAYIKYPCTHEGLRAAQMSVQKSIRVNMTSVFFAGASGCRICCNEGIKGAGVCIAICRQA